MKTTINDPKQQLLIKDLQLMIATVKAYYQIRGTNITMEEMSARMDRGKKFLTHITNGNQPISKDHIILFKEYFKNELPFGLLGQTDLENIANTFHVILREISIIQSRVKDGEDPVIYAERLEKEIDGALAPRPGSRIVS